MKFIVPGAKDEEHAKGAYEEIVRKNEKFISQKTTGRKIYSIKYHHEGKDYYATVGEKENRQGEVTIAILELSDVYLVCTWHRGVKDGEPILVEPSSITDIVDFED